MNTFPWILVEILVPGLLVVVLVVVARKKERRPTDYCSFFVIGVIWFPVGAIFLLLERSSGMGSFFLIMGLAHLAIGLANRDKWGKQVEMPPETRKRMMIVLGLAALVGASVALPFTGRFFLLR